VSRDFGLPRRRTSEQLLRFIEPASAPGRREEISRTRNRVQRISSSRRTRCPSAGTGRRFRLDPISAKRSRPEFATRDSESSSSLTAKKIEAQSELKTKRASIQARSPETRTSPEGEAARRSSPAQPQRTPENATQARAPSGHHATAQRSGFLLRFTISPRAPQARGLPDERVCSKSKLDVTTPICPSQSRRLVNPTLRWPRQ